jgi:heparinase II-like protein
MQFLHLIQMGERQTPGKIDSDDLAGLRLGQWAILFNTEMRMATSAVSFDVAGPAQMKFLIAGLAPGIWEIWRAGMREQDDVGVAPESGVLHFEGKPGSYFLRPL